MGTSLVLFVLVWRLGDPAEVVRVVRGASPRWVIASIAAFLGYQWLRMRRTALLLGLRGDRRLFATVCVQGAANDLILPAATGDLALGYLLKRWHDVGYGSGFASLLIGRVTDLALFAVLLAILAVVYGPGSPALLLAVIAVVLVLLLATSAALWLLVMRGRTDAPPGSRWRGVVARQLRALSEGTHEIHSRTIYPRLVIQSVAMWLAMYVSYVALARALDAPLGLLEVLMLYVLVFPVDLSPIKGFANVGTHEGTWYIALRVLGVESAEAAVLSVASHALILLALLVTGAIGGAYVVRDRASHMARHVNPNSL